MQEIHNNLINNSKIYSSWHQEEKHKVAHWAIFVFISILLADSFLSHAVVALGLGSGVEFTVNKLGIQTLTYNGQNYLGAPASGNGPLVNAAYFKAPDGTEKSYGWTATTLGHDDFYYSVASTTAGADWFQHIYRSGKTDSITVKITYIAVDSNTLKIQTSIKNNDPTDTLSRIYFYATFLPLVLPGAANQYNQNIPIDLGPQNQWGGYPVAFLSGSWGSTAVWMGDYSSPVDQYAYYSSTTQTQFGFYLQNFSTNQAGYKYEDSIAPGATKTYITYLRFGTVGDTATSLAPEAFSLFRQAYPSIVNWPDRRPIARWFIAEGTKRSATNPRGYLWDSTLDISNQANFNTKVLSLTDNIITRLNNMNPKPQGITVWDLEGQEFEHAFTYVGYPNKLPVIAPEMDAVADQVFAKFRNAGYKVGMTIRPNEFGAGPTPPATCHYDAYPKNDIWVDTDAPIGQRRLGCTASSTWYTITGSWGFQQSINNDDAIYDLLRSKIAYAKNRWGATIFYMDSSVYSQGGPFNFNIIRRLQQEFPDVMLFPENESLGFWGASAPYNQANTGQFDTPIKAKDIYPQAFSMIEAHNLDYTDPVVYDKLVNSVRNGNILYVDGWYTNTQDNYILQAYRDAGVFTPPPVSPPTIISLIAIPASIISGQSSTLSWSVSGATTVSLDQGVGDVTSLTSKIVSPTATTTYTLTATNAGGSVTSQITVGVSSVYVPPPTNKFIIGDRIHTTAKVKVRATPTSVGKALCTQNKNISGTITSGPQTGSGFTWWQVDFDSSCDGWSVQDYLVK